MKAVCLFSGGSESLLAAWLVGRSGCDIALLHLDGRMEPSVDVDAAASALEERLGRPVTLMAAPMGAVLQSILDDGPRGMQCALCRRAMLLTAAALAKRVGADAVVTGEALGRTSSQTLQNMASVSVGLDVPVLRPLAAFSKAEIAERAREAGFEDLRLTCRFARNGSMTMVPGSAIAEQESLLSLRGAAEALASAAEVRSTRRSASASGPACRP